MRKKNIISRSFESSPSQKAPKMSVPNIIGWDWSSKYYCSDTSAYNITPPSSSLDNYIFQFGWYFTGSVPTSPEAALSEPRSSIVVYDLSTSASSPSSFEWTPPELDVPGYVSAKPGLVHEDDLYVVIQNYPYYTTRAPEDSGYNLPLPKLVKFSGVTVDFAGSSISYTSVEFADLTHAGVFRMTIDGLGNGLISYAHDSFGYAANTPTDPPIDSFTLSGPLVVTRNVISDGGLNVDGVFMEWYGSDWSSETGFQFYDGIEYIGQYHRSTVHGDYYYFPAQGLSTESNKINPNIDASRVDLVCRVPKDNISSRDDICVIYYLNKDDHPKLFYTANQFTGSTGHFLGDGQSFFILSTRGSASQFLAKLDLGDPEGTLLYSQDYFDWIASRTDPPDYDEGKPNWIGHWGDKIVVNHWSKPAIWIGNKSDLSEAGSFDFLDVAALTPPVGGETAVMVFEPQHITIIGDYLYVSLNIFQGNDDVSETDEIFASLDLNNLTTSGFTIIRDHLTGVEAGTNYVYNSIAHPSITVG